MADTSISLEFISRQLTQMREEAHAFRSEMQTFRRHVDSRFDALEGRVGMLQGLLTRLDSADMGIQAEVRGLREMVVSQEQRITRLETASEG